jgi:hypothetical protein
MCGDVIAYAVDNVENFDAFDQRARMFVQSNAFVQILPSECASLWKKFICAGAFVECEVEANGDVAQKPPCRSLCTSLLEGPCEGLLPDSVRDVLDCAQFEETGCNAMESIAAPVESPQVSYSASAMGASGICEGYVAEFHAAVPAIPGEIGEPQPPLSPPGTAQVSFERVVLNLVSNFPAYLPSTCQTALRRYACLSTFLGVSGAPIEDGGEDFPFPRFPCSSICRDTQVACGEILASFLPGVDICDIVDDLQLQTAFGPLPFYPESVQNITVSPFDTPVQTQCQQDWPDDDFNVRVQCPGRLLPFLPGSRVDNPIIMTGCALPCPLITFTEKEERTFFYTLFVCALCSSVCGVLYLMVSFSDPQILKKANTNNLIPLLFCCNSVVVAVGIVMSLAPYLHAPTEMFCVNEVAGKRQADHGWCLFQAILLCYTPTVAGSWWLCLAYDLYQRVVALENTSQNMLKYHLFSWLMPLVGTFSLLGLEKAGTHPPPLPPSVFTLLFVVLRTLSFCISA